MSLLSYSRLCELVEQGVITNVEHDQINATSIDITVGDTFLIETPRITRDIGSLYLSNRDRPQMTEIKAEEGDFILFPGQFALAHSQQVFNLPNNISCEYKLKSSMARIALEHLNAGWCDAGWNGSVLTLELINFLKYHSVMIKPGDRIGQMIFFEHEEVPADRSYAARGRYNGDRSVSGIKE